VAISMPSDPLDWFFKIMSRPGLSRRLFLWFDLTYEPEWYWYVLKGISTMIEISENITQYFTQNPDPQSKSISGDDITHF
jgi:hypothetical protein